MADAFPTELVGLLGEESHKISEQGTTGFDQWVRPCLT